MNITWSLNTKNEIIWEASDYLEKIANKYFQLGDLNKHFAVLEAVSRLRRTFLELNYGPC